MTFFIHHGTCVHTLPETIDREVYLLLKPVRLQIEEPMDMNRIPDNKIEFKFLIKEDGHSIYINNTSLLPYFSSMSNKKSGNPVNFNINIKDKVYEVLDSYRTGFIKLWQDWNIRGKNDYYKIEGMNQMFDMIASKIESEIKA